MSEGRTHTRAEQHELALSLRAMGEAAAREAPDDEFLVLRDGLAPLFEAIGMAGYHRDYDVLKTATRQLLEGACESAILGLIPADATVSGVRLGTGMVSATVALDGRRGYQTETAATLALGWFFAFTHALTDMLEE